MRAEFGAKLSGEMYQLPLILGAVFASIVILNGLRRKGLVALAIDPLVLFSLFFMIIHFLMPLIKLRLWRFRYESSYSELVIAYAGLVALLVYLTAVLLGNLLFSRTWRRYKYSIQINNRPTHRTLRIALVTAVAMVMIGVFFSWLDVRTIKTVAGGLDLFLTDRGLIAQQRSSTRAFSNMAIVGTALLLAVRMHLPGHKYLILVWALSVGFLVYYAFAISSRNMVLILLVLNLTVYLFYSSKLGIVGKFSFRQAALVGVAILSVGFAAKGILGNRYSVVDNAYTAERRDQLLFYSLDGAFGNDEARWWMLENGQTYFFGKTYLAGLTVFIPRSIFPAKPLGGGPHLINMIRTGSYVIGARGNNSLTTGLLVEARMNFGLPGVFLVILAWVATMNACLKRLFRSTSITQQVMFLSLATFLSTSFIYSEFLGWLVRTAIFVLPLFFGTLLERVRFGRKIARHI